MTQCCVPRCKNIANHIFPREENLRKLWEAATRREAKKSSKICAAHFKSEDFVKVGMITGLLNKRRIIKKGAVPSVFQWTETENRKYKEYVKYKERQEILKAQELNVSPFGKLFPNVITATCNSSKMAALHGHVEELVDQEHYIADRNEINMAPVKQEAVYIKQEPEWDSGEEHDAPHDVLRAEQIKAELDYTESASVKLEFEGEGSGGEDASEQPASETPKSEPTQRSVPTSSQVKMEYAEAASVKQEPLCSDSGGEDASEEPASEGLASEDPASEEPTQRSIPTSDPALNQASEAQESTHSEESSPEKSGARRKTHSCDICGRKFKRRNHVTRHMRSHANNTFTCEICKKQCKRLSALMKHKLVHAERKTFICDICHKQFRSSCDLVRHTRTHTGERPYSCDACDKQFKQLISLNYHRAVHSEEGRLKPFACEICEKRFSQLGNLKSHKRSHTGEKPYSCEICLRQFTRSGELTRHRRIHTGDKPYSCNICQKQFSQISSLSYHTKLHTGENIKKPV